MQIVFENDHFLCVDKPYGWLSILPRPGSSSAPCLITYLNSIRKRVFIVHRLDRETSGLLLVAKNSRAHRAACNWFESQKIKKKYEALTALGSMAPAEGVVIWESLLFRGKRRTFEASHGKIAKTEARCLGRIDVDGKSYLRWELWPVTGRNHQLRFELSKRGYPIVGDALYGSSEKSFDEDAIALRSVELDFSQVPLRSEFDLPSQVRVESLLSK